MYCFPTSRRLDLHRYRSPKQLCGEGIFDPPSTEDRKGGSEERTSELWLGFHFPSLGRALWDHRAVIRELRSHLSIWLVCLSPLFLVQCRCLAFFVRVRGESLSDAASFHVSSVLKLPASDSGFPRCIGNAKNPQGPQEPPRSPGTRRISNNSDSATIDGGRYRPIECIKRCIEHEQILRTNFQRSSSPVEQRLASSLRSERRLRLDSNFKAVLTLTQGDATRKNFSRGSGLQSDDNGSKASVI